MWSILASLWEGAARGMITSFIVRLLDCQEFNRLGPQEPLFFTNHSPLSSWLSDALLAVTRVTLPSTSATAFSFAFMIPDVLNRAL